MPGVRDYKHRTPVDSGSAFFDDTYSLVGDVYLLWSRLATAEEVWPERKRRSADRGLFWCWIV